MSLLSPFLVMSLVYIKGCEIWERGQSSFERSESQRKGHKRVVSLLERSVFLIEKVSVLRCVTECEWNRFKKWGVSFPLTVPDCISSLIFLVDFWQSWWLDVGFILKLNQGKTVVFSVLFYDCFNGVICICMILGSSTTNLI